MNVLNDNTALAQLPSIEISVSVNGVSRTLKIEPRKTLLEMLRNGIGLMGTKQSCDVQVCGACSVLLNGKVVSACTVLAYEARDAEVLTIEALSDGNSLHPIQEAFLEHRGVQCGFCTPGMVLTTKALLEEIPSPNAEQIKSYMRGNLCRCTGYRPILDSIEAAAQKLKA